MSFLSSPRPSSSFTTTSRSDDKSFELLLSRVPSKFFSRTFNPFEYYEDDHELDQVRGTVNEAVNLVVENCYRAFNSSTSSFRHVLKTFKDSQTAIKQLQIDVTEGQRILFTHNHNLKDLYRQQMTHQHILQILTQVETINSIPTRIASYLSRHQYYRAVTLLLHGLDLLNTMELRQVTALYPVREDLLLLKQDLQRLLYSELKNIIFLSDTRLRQSVLDDPDIDPHSTASGSSPLPLQQSHQSSYARYNSSNKATFLRNSGTTTFTGTTSHFTFTGSAGTVENKYAPGFGYRAAASSLASGSPGTDQFSATATSPTAATGAKGGANSPVKLESHVDDDVTGPPISMNILKSSIFPSFVDAMAPLKPHAIYSAHQHTKDGTIVLSEGTKALQSYLSTYGYTLGEIVEEDFSDEDTSLLPFLILCQNATNAEMLDGLQFLSDASTASGSSSDGGSSSTVTTTTVTAVDSTGKKTSVTTSNSKESESKSPSSQQTPQLKKKGTVFHARYLYRLLCLENAPSYIADPYSHPEEYMCILVETLNLLNYLPSVEQRLQKQSPDSIRQIVQREMNALSQQILEFMIQNNKYHFYQNNARSTLGGTNLLTSPSIVGESSLIQDIQSISSANNIYQHDNVILALLPWDDSLGHLKDRNIKSGSSSIGGDFKGMPATSASFSKTKGNSGGLFSKPNARNRFNSNIKNRKVGMHTSAWNSTVAAGTGAGKIDFRDSFANPAIKSMLTVLHQDKNFQSTIFVDFLTIICKICVRVLLNQKRVMSHLLALKNMPILDQPMTIQEYVRTINNTYMNYEVLISVHEIIRRAYSNIQLQIQHVSWKFWDKSRDPISFSIDDEVIHQILNSASYNQYKQQLHKNAALTGIQNLQNLRPEMFYALFKGSTTPFKNNFININKNVTNRAISTSGPTEETLRFSFANSRAQSIARQNVQSEFNSFDYEVEARIRAQKLKESRKQSAANSLKSISGDLDDDWYDMDDEDGLMATTEDKDVWFESSPYNVALSYLPLLHFADTCNIIVDGTQQTPYLPAPPMYQIFPHFIRNNYNFARAAAAGPTQLGFMASVSPQSSVNATKPDLSDDVSMDDFLLPVCDLRTAVQQRVRVEEAKKAKTEETKKSKKKEEEANSLTNAFLSHLPNHLMHLVPVEILTLPTQIHKQTLGQLKDLVTTQPISGGVNIQPTMASPNGQHCDDGSDDLQFDSTSFKIHTNLFKPYPVPQNKSLLQNATLNTSFFHSSYPLTQSILLVIQDILLPHLHNDVVRAVEYIIESPTSFHPLENPLINNTNSTAAMLSCTPAHLQAVQDGSDLKSGSTSPNNNNTTPGAASATQSPVDACSQSELHCHRPQIYQDAALNATTPFQSLYSFFASLANGTVVSQLLLQQIIDISAVPLNEQLATAQRFLNNSSAPIIHGAFDTFTLMRSLSQDMCLLPHFSSYIISLMQYVTDRFVDAVKLKYDQIAHKHPTGSQIFSTSLLSDTHNVHAMTKDLWFIDFRGLPRSHLMKPHLSLQQRARSIVYTRSLITPQVHDAIDAFFSTDNPSFAKLLSKDFSITSGQLLPQVPIDFSTTSQRSVVVSELQLTVKDAKKKSTPNSPTTASINTSPSSTSNEQSRGPTITSNIANNIMSHRQNAMKPLSYLALLSSSLDWLSNSLYNICLPGITPLSFSQAASSSSSTLPPVNRKQAVMRSSFYIPHSGQSNLSGSLPKSPTNMNSPVWNVNTASSALTSGMLGGNPLLTSQFTQHLTIIPLYVSQDHSRSALMNALKNPLYTVPASFRNGIYIPLLSDSQQTADHPFTLSTPSFVNDHSLIPELSSADGAIFSSQQQHNTNIHSSLISNFISLPHAYLFSNPTGGTAGGGVVPPVALSGIHDATIIGGNILGSRGGNINSADTLTRNGILTNTTTQYSNINHYFDISATGAQNSTNLMVSTITQPLLQHNPKDGKQSTMALSRCIALIKMLPKTSHTRLYVAEEGFLRQYIGRDFDQYGSPGLGANNTNGNKHTFDVHEQFQTIPPEWQLSQLHSFLSIKRFQLAQKLYELSNVCMFTIKLEIIARICYYLNNAKVSNYNIKPAISLNSSVENARNFKQQYKQYQKHRRNQFLKIASPFGHAQANRQVSNLLLNIDAEPFVLELNKDLISIDESLSRFCDTSRRNYIYGGLSFLISRVVVQNFAAMHCKLVSHLGVKMIHRNLHAIQQCLLSFLPQGHSLSILEQYPDYFHHNAEYLELNFSRVRNFIEFMKTTLLFLQSQAQQTSFPFNQTEYNILVEIITNNQREKERLRQLHNNIKQLDLSREQAQKWTSYDINHQRQKKINNKAENYAAKHRKEEVISLTDFTQTPVPQPPAAAPVEAPKKPEPSSESEDSDDYNATKSTTTTTTTTLDPSYFTTINRDVQVQRNRTAFGSTTTTTKTTVIRTAPEAPKVTTTTTTTTSSSSSGNAPETPKSASRGFFGRILGKK